MTRSSANPWFTTPAIAHREWRAGLVISERAYAEQSQRLYISLFGRFCVWLAGQKLSLKTIKSVDLARFLDALTGRNGAPAANRTQRTYIAEIDRVFAHLQNEGLRSDNPARTMLNQLRVTTPLRPRSISLPGVDTRTLYLKSLPASGLRGMAPEDLQACAMNLLMVDAGFTLKELQKLMLKHVERVGEGEIYAPGHRTLMGRTLKLTPEASKWLAHWLAVRNGLKVITQAQYKTLQAAGKMGLSLSSKAPQGQSARGLRNARAKVFVSFTGKSGKPLGLRSSGLVLDKLPESTIYLSAQDVILAGRKLSPTDRKALRNKGPQALRNLCCATLVAKGLPTGEVAAFMGLQRSDQVWAMERTLRGVSTQ